MGDRASPRVVLASQLSEQAARFSDAHRLEIRSGLDGSNGQPSAHVKRHRSNEADVEQETLLQRRPARQEGLVRAIRFAGVDVDIRAVDHGLPVLDVKPGLRPLGHGAREIASSTLRVAVQESQRDGEARPEVDRRVDVPALFGARAETDEALSRLGHVAEEVVRVHREEPRIHETRLAPVGARVRALEELSRRSPVPAVEEPDAARTGIVERRVRAAVPLGQYLCEPHELSFAPALGSSPRGELCRFDAQGAHHLKAIAGAQRFHEMTRLHAGADDDVDDGKPERHRGERFDPEARLGRDLFG